MNNLRRLAAVLLSLMMIFSLTATASAESAAPYEELASEKDKDRLIVSKIPYVLTGEQNSA